jgi:hypothetical protein
MAEQDLNHASGNETLKEMLSKMNPTKNLQGNPYGQQNKAPYLPTDKVTRKGWNK